jgi:hypothetical protein
VLARSEFDAEGPLELKRVEEKFVRTAVVMELVVGGQSIKTTAEHPFYVPAKEAFVPAGELRVGDQLISHDGGLIPITSIDKTGQLTTVYNLRVADFHTYFVGSSLWGFDVWVHNARYSKASLSNQPEIAYRRLSPEDIISLEAGGGIVRVGSRGNDAKVLTISGDSRATRFIPVTEDSQLIHGVSDYIAFRTKETNYISMNALLSDSQFMSGMGKNARYVEQQMHGLVVGEIPRSSITTFI